VTIAYWRGCLLEELPRRATYERICLPEGPLTGGASSWPRPAGHDRPLGSSLRDLLRRLLLRNQLVQLNQLGQLSLSVSLCLSALCLSALVGLSALCLCAEVDLPGRAASGAACRGREAAKAPPGAYLALGEERPRSAAAPRVQSSRASG